MIVLDLPDPLRRELVDVLTHGATDLMVRGRAVSPELARILIELRRETPRADPSGPPPPASPPIPHDEPVVGCLLTRQEAAELLRVSVRQLDRLDLAKVRLGRRVLYHRQTIVDVIEERTHAD